MLPLDTLTTFVFASALLSIAPGPDNLFVLMHSAIYGRKSGILVTLGLCTGLVVHTTAVALGIAVIFQSSDIAFTALKIFGALYLAYLAWQAFNAPSTETNAPDANLKTAYLLYRRGIILNITNPKVSIFFLAFLPQFTSPENGSVAYQLLILGGVFIVVALITFGAIAFAAGSLGGWLRGSPTVQLYLNRIAGTVFAGLSVHLAIATTLG